MLQKLLINLILFKLILCQDGISKEVNIFNKVSYTMNNYKVFAEFIKEFKAVGDLKKRIKSSRPLLPALDGKYIGQTYGTHEHLLDKVLDYWYHHYDFKAREKYFNQYDHFITNVQGLDIHFVHVHPKNPGKKRVLPLLLLHGGADTFKEFYNVIPYLTEPNKGHHFVYELIIPSLPGHGYSQATSKVGLGYHKMASIMRNLMQRLGYKQYYIQAGDFGHIVSTALSILYPADVLGFHSNFPFSLRPRTLARYLLGAFNPSSVVKPKYEDRLYPISERFYYYITEFGYFHLQATKPDTLAAVDQSPSGLAGYFYEKYAVVTNYDKIRKWDGNLPKLFNFIDLLDEITIYWMTKTAQSSFRLYAESTAFIQDPTIWKLINIPVEVPFAAIKFKHEVIYQPDSFIKDKFPFLVHSTTLDFGGHFAGKENPDVLAHDLFEATEEFIKFNKKYKRYNSYCKHDEYDCF